MRFALIDEAKKDFPVDRLCTTLGVSPSGYFAWGRRPACRRQQGDMIMLAHVRSSFALSNGTYGSPRMTRELQEQSAHWGFTIGRRRTARLMRENGLQARQKRRFKRTTDSEHAFPIAPNVIDQDFAATGPNQKWGADISYIWTREGWLYLAVVIDLFARKVVGLKIRAGLLATGCTAASLWPRSTRRSPCGSRNPVSFTTLTAAANIVLSTTRPNCVPPASLSRCRARAIALTMPWSKHSSRR
jgi:putative transposase